MATIDLGKLAFVNKGTYSSSTSYEKNDLVQYTDSGVLSTYLYINSTAATGQTPSTSGTVNGTYWAFFAKGGADGAAGSSGDTFGLNNNEIAIKNNSGSLDGLAIGSAGQVLTVNSGANGFEFATPAGGGTISAYGMSYNYSTQNLINGFSSNVAFQGSSNSGNYLSDSTVIKMGASYNTSTPYNSMWLQATGRYLVTHYIYAGFAGTSNGGEGASVAWEPYYIRNNQMNFVQYARNAQIYQEKQLINNTNYTYRVGQTMTYLHTATTTQEYIVLKGNAAWKSGNFNVYVFNTFIAKYD